MRTAVNKLLYLERIIHIIELAKHLFKEIKGSYIAGSIPEVALTNAVNRTVTWVDPTRPEEWTEKVEADLAVVEKK